MKKKTVEALIAAAAALDKHCFDYPGIHAWECASIDANNNMHFAAMEYLGISENCEQLYDPQSYLLKATTPEQCAWVRLRISSNPATRKKATHWRRAG